MAEKGWTARVAAAAGAAAAIGAAQLGLGYGLGVVIWPPSGAPDDSVWLGSLGWATWIAASATVFGAVFASRLGSPAVRLRGPWRFAFAASAAVGALVAVALIALPARESVRADTFSPQVIAGGYAMIGLLLGLVVAYWAVVSRPVAANLIATAAWLWALAVAAIVVELTLHRSSATYLTSWQFAESGDAHRYGTIYWPSAVLTLAAALLIGIVATVPAVRRGDLGTGTAASGAVGPLMVAAAFFVLAPQLTGTLGPLESAYLIAPYAVLAGLAGSALTVALGGAAANRRTRRATVGDVEAGPARDVGSAAVPEARPPRRDVGSAAVDVTRPPGRDVGSAAVDVARHPGRDSGATAVDVTRPPRRDVGSAAFTEARHPGRDSGATAVDAVGKPGRDVGPAADDVAGAAPAALPAQRRRPWFRLKSRSGAEPDPAASQEPAGPATGDGEGQPPTAAAKPASRKRANALPATATRSNPAPQPATATRSNPAAQPATATSSNPAAQPVDATRSNSMAEPAGATRANPGAGNRPGLAAQSATAQPGAAPRSNPTGRATPTAPGFFGRDDAGKQPPAATGPQRATPPVATPPRATPSPTTSPPTAPPPATPPPAAPSPTTRRPTAPEPVGPSTASGPIGDATDAEIAAAARRGRGRAKKAAPVEPEPKALSSTVTPPPTSPTIAQINPKSPTAD